MNTSNPTSTSSSSSSEPSPNASVKEFQAIEQQLIKSLAESLFTTVKPETCTTLAIMLLSHGPADEIRVAMQQLDVLLRRDLVGGLPIDISLNVLSYMSAADLIKSVLPVSRWWYVVGTHPILWRKIYRKQGWELDMDRWKLYKFLPAYATPSQALLDEAVRVASKILLKPKRAPTLLFSSAVCSDAAASRARELGDPEDAHPATVRRVASQLETPQPLPPIHWYRLFSDYKQLQHNWRRGVCQVGQWDQAHSDFIYCMQFDQNNRLFTGSRDRTTKVWHFSEDSNSIMLLATLYSHTRSVVTMFVEGDMLATGSSDGTVCLWDLTTYELIQRLEHPDTVLSVRFNDLWLATACKDHVIRIWKRSDNGFGGSCSFKLQGHTVAINAIQLHGNTLVSGSGDHTIRVWHLAQKHCDKVMTGHTRGVACLDFDGRYIVSGSGDLSIRMWDSLTGRCLWTKQHSHGCLVRTVAFNRGLGAVVSGSYDETIAVWSVNTGKMWHRISNVHRARIFKVVVDKTRIVSSSQDCSVAVVNFATGLPNARLLV